VQDIEQIYQEYFETVYKYLFCLTRDNDLSEDLTQETFCKAVKKINTYNGECKISVWLCQIAKHLYYDYCRKKKKTLDVDDEILENIAEDCGVEEQVVSNSEKVLLYKKMQKLDKDTREVIYLRITGELSFREIGDILNKSENWARLTFYRGKLKLKEGEANEK